MFLLTRHTDSYVDGNGDDNLGSITISLNMEYKLDHRVTLKNRLTDCISDSEKIIWKSIKKSVILSTNENVLVNIGIEQM